MSDLCRVLNEYLARIEIRDPLKSLLRPSLEFVLAHDSTISLRIVIHSVDATSGGPFSVPSAYELAPYQVSRYSRDVTKLAQFVHHCLLEALRHEVDESVWLNGTHVIAPTHWGR